MLEIRNERVVSFVREYLDVYWEIVPTTEDLQEYTFTVERSESEGGPWIPITPPMTDRYHVRDGDLATISNTRVFFYRIRLTHTPSARETFSKVICQDRNPDLVAMEIIRCEQLLYREHSGTKAWVFPRRTFGQKCPQCFDPVLRKRISDACPTCFNVTFSGGYHYPIEFWGQLDEPELAEQASVENHEQKVYFVLRTGPTPFIKPLDLIIDLKNRRHRVVSVGGTTKAGSRVQQVVRTVIVQKGSIEDRVPLKIDAATVQLRPARNFTNPQSLETADRNFDIDSMLRLYRY